jgi:catechol 2,3-dioxygenase-like lactoylglutathione lyase family enzyme
MPRFLSFRPNFFVANIDRALGFYRDILGFEVTLHAPEMGLAILKKDDAQLALVLSSACSSDILWNRFE